MSFSLDESKIAPEAELSAEETSEVVGADVDSALESMRKMFDTMDPPSTIKIMDAFGGEHTTRALLPARKQVRVMRELEALSGADVSMEAISNMGDGAEGIVAAIVAMANDEAVLDSLSRAFALAHPKIVARARNAAIADGESEEDTKHVADLFPVEEIVSGLVPFFLRLANRMMSLLGPVSKAIAVQ